MPAGSTLDETLAESHCRLARWRQERTRVSQFELRRCVHSLKQERAELEDLRLSATDIQRQVKDVEAARSLRHKVGEATDLSAKTASRHAETALSAKVQLCEGRETFERRLQHDEQALASRQCSVTEMAGKMERFLSLYREHLGFAISRAAPQTIRMAFTLLDHSDPSREFYLTLRLTFPEGYHVLDCSPPVPQLISLVGKLNDSADSSSALPTFVCGIRQAFKQRTTIARDPWL